LLSVKLNIGKRAVGQEHLDELDLVDGCGSWVDGGEYGDRVRAG
jgi:hypothetical protein